MAKQFCQCLRGKLREPRHRHNVTAADKVIYNEIATSSLPRALFKQSIVGGAFQSGAGYPREGERGSDDDAVLKCVRHAIGVVLIWINITSEQETHGRF